MSFPSRQLLFVFCAAALVLAGSAVVVADSAERSPVPWESTTVTDHSTVMIEADNSTNYLSPDGDNVTRMEYQGATLDVAGAVESDTLQLQGEHQRKVLEQRLENEPGTTVAVDTIARLERDITTLEQEQRQLYRSYSDGELDTPTLFREIVSLGVTADQYRTLAMTAEDSVAETGELNTRYTNLDSEIPMLPSPFVTHIGTELRTEGGTPMYVQAGNESLVLAAVQGNTYLREAVLFSERDRNMTDQFGTGDRSGAEDAFNRAGQLYPWTMDNRDKGQSRVLGNTSVYQVQFGHTHGELETYLDGGTTNPFYEVQEKNPLAVPVEFTQTLSDGLRLDIEMTNPTGPMRVEVIDTRDEEFERLTVSIDGNTVATKSDGGSIATVQPRGPFEISAETDTGREVSLFLTPS